MLLSSPLAAETTRCSAIFAGLELDKSYLSCATVVRDVPVEIVPAESIGSSQQVQQHYQTLQVEGPADAIPNRISVEIESIAHGGQINVDSLCLPAGCEVIGVWFTNPIVSISR